MSVAEDAGVGEAAKADLATLLARLFLLELDPPALEALCRPAVLEILDKLEPGCAAYLGSHPWTPADFDEAAADYCELFVLSKKTCPFASAWTADGEPQVQGLMLARRVDEIRAALALETETTYGSLPPDHAGVLFGLLAEAWRRDPELAGEIVHELLEPWIPAWSRACRAVSSNPLYRAASDLASQLIAV